MRTTIAYSTSVLVHVAAIVGLACYLPAEIGPRLNHESGITIVASFAQPISQAEPQPTVILEDMKSEPLPQEPAKPAPTDLPVTPSATQLTRRALDVPDVIPVKATPAEKDETPPQQTAAKQVPNQETPPPEKAAQQPASRQTATNFEVAEHNIVLPPQTAVATGAVDRLPRQSFLNRKPAYPPEEARAGITGVVHVRCLIAASGLVERAVVAKSSGSARLDEAAVIAVRTYQFEPAQRGGRAVPLEVILPFDFIIR